MIRAGKQRWNASVKITFDGNSLVAGAGLTSASDFLPNQTMARPLLAGSGATFANVAISGQSWADMTANATDVDNAWDASKSTNVLVAWEGTNSIYNTNKTAAEAYADTKAYLAARLALRPWRVVLMTCLPRHGTITNAQRIEDYNELLRANFRDLGAHALCDIQQPGSPFRHRGDSVEPFRANQHLWFESAVWTHTNAAGVQIEAQMLEATLRRLPARS